MIARLRRWHRSRRDQERGAVLILTAIAMVAVLGAGALGVDVGFTVVGSRTAQAMADTAAADLIQYINVADQAGCMTSTVSCPNSVQSYLNTELAGVIKDNKSSTQLFATPLLYQNGKYEIPSTGCQDTVPFIPSTPVCNAVAVTAQQAVPQPFWGGFNSLVGKSGSGLPSGTGCGATSTGGCGGGCNGSPCFSCPTGGCSTCPATACDAWTPQSCFSIGSYLVSIGGNQQGVLNDILSKLGTTATVTAVGYQGLANTYVSFNQLITASGTQLTQSDVMTTPYPASTWLSIFKDAVDNQTSSGNCSTGSTTEQTNAETALASLTFGSTSVRLCDLVSVNGSSCNSNNSTLSYASLQAGVNVLQLLTTEAELADEGNAIDVTFALGLSGVTSSSLTFSAIQPAQIAFGPVGSYTAASPCPAAAGKTSTCAETQQVKADLQLTIPVGGVIDIPLSAAQGFAALKVETCLNDAFQNNQITALTNTATATMTLAGTSFATLSIAGASNTLPFNSTIVPPTATTISAASPGNNPKPIGTSNPTLVITQTNASLYAVANAGNLLSNTLGGFLEPVLQAAGVSVGNADVADLGNDCDAIEPTP